MIFWYLVSFPFWISGIWILYMIARDFKRFGLKAFTETPVLESFAIWFGLVLLAVAGHLCGVI